MDTREYKSLISSIYRSFEAQLPLAVMAAIKNVVETGLDARGTVNIFFRADDIGVSSKNYDRMMALFLKYRLPLCLAVVPAWMTRQRWEAMKGFIEKGGELFCWHMHGYRHVNHETKGKNQEFGPQRSSRALFHDLSRGHDRLFSIMGENLTKVFTPPWNRCSLETMEILKNMGFDGVSRSHGNLPLPPRGFEDFSVHVDLHTRKEKEAEKGWQNLLSEFENGMGTNACGIMIHHMRMNNQAFILLEYLLELFCRYKQIKPVTYKDLISH